MSLKDKIKDFLLVHKSLIQIGVPLFFSAILSIIGFLNFSIINKICIYIILLLIILFLLFKMMKVYDENDRKESAVKDELQKTIENMEEELKNQKNSFEQSKNELIAQVRKLRHENDCLVSIYVPISKNLITYSTGINNVADKILNGHNPISEDEWHLSEYCENLCEKCLDTIQIATGIEENISVNFITVYEDEYIGFTGSVGHSIPNKNYMKLEECNMFYKDIIKKGNSEVVYLASSNDIKKYFVSKDGNKKSLNKYSQYIGVPVLCDKNKVVGLLQIVTEDGCKLGRDKKELRCFYKKYIYPYVSNFLLIHKIKKGIFALPPKEKNK